MERIQSTSRRFGHTGEAAQGIQGNEPSRFPRNGNWSCSGRCDGPPSFARNFIDSTILMAQLRAIPTPMSSSSTHASSTNSAIRLSCVCIEAQCGRKPRPGAESGVFTWSDIPANMQLRWLEEDGSVHQQFRYPSNNSNGNFFDYQGRQVACEHGTRRVARYELDGGYTVLAEKSPDGKGLNAPNDGCAHPDGWNSITDPGYGALMNYEGERLKATTPQPIQKEAVYRIDGPGIIEKVADEPFKPNGICFSPDLKKVYIADTARRTTGCQEHYLGLRRGG